MVGKLFWGTSGTGRCLPQGVRSAVATGGCRQHVWVDLPLGPEPAARGARRGTWGGADHAAVVEPFSGAPRARPALEGRAVRGRAAGLADRTLRSDAAAAGCGSRVARPLRQPRVPRQAAVVIGGEKSHCL